MCVCVCAILERKRENENKREREGTKRSGAKSHTFLSPANASIQDNHNSAHTHAKRQRDQNEILSSVASISHEHFHICTLNYTNQTAL